MELGPQERDDGDVLVALDAPQLVEAAFEILEVIPQILGALIALGLAARLWLRPSPPASLALPR